MESEKRNTVFAVIFAVLLLTVFGFYIYQDLFKSETKDEQSLENTATTTPNSISTATSTIDISVEDENGDNITITPTEINSESQEKQEIIKPIPDLDREIVFTDDFPEDARQIIIDKIEQLSQELKNNPTSFSNWLYLGLNRKAISDYEGVKSAWEYAKRLDSNNFVVRGNLGDLYAYYLKDNQKAEENYLKAIELGPTQIYLYFKIAEFYADFLKNNQKAVEIVQKGLIHSPNSQELQSLLQSLTKN